MSRLIKQSYHIARKDYDCEASPFIEYIPDMNFLETISEYRAYIKARDNGFKIVKGDEYLKMILEFDGSIFTARMIPEIHEICVKYGLYPDEE